MTALSVTRSLVSATNPTEAQFDTMRSELLAFFNTTSLDEDNLSPAGLSMLKLSDAGDDAPLAWESSLAEIEFITSGSIFNLYSSTAISFLMNMAGTTAEAARLATTGTLTLSDGGIPQFGKGVGSQAVNTMWLLARYRKPRLEFTDVDTVTSENNTGEASQSVVVLRDRVCVVVDRSCSLAATANGYEADDTGAAVSGLEIGLTRTDNRWYYVYAVRVQYGDDADGTKAILVASATSPLQANAATLDTAYGTGEWVYLGCIRNGYNDGSNGDKILSFIYDEYGFIRFTSTTETGKGLGLRLAAATASSSDLSYSLAFGVGAAQIPNVATRGIFACWREANGFEVDYHSTVTGEDNMRASNCQHHNSAIPALIHMDVPLISGYDVILRVGSGSTDQRIMLAGLQDQFV